MTVLTRPADNGRGCGFRDEEMPYLCTGMSSGGMPLEHFIIDPVPLYDDVWQRGYTLVEMNGAVHVLIFVSGETYPSPWDFFAEAKMYGVSRKIPTNFPFDALTPGVSMMYFVHRRAIPDFWYRVKGSVYGEDQVAHMTRLHSCKWKPRLEMCEKEGLSQAEEGKFWPHFEVPTGYHPPQAKEKCTFALKSLSWFVHQDGYEGYNVGGGGNGDRFQIMGPSFSYMAFVPDVTDDEVKWLPGVFMGTYVSHVEYAAKADKDSANRARAAGYDVNVVDW